MFSLERDILKKNVQQKIFLQSNWEILIRIINIKTNVCIFHFVLYLLESS